MCDEDTVRIPPTSTRRVKVKIVSIKEGKPRVPDPDEIALFSISGKTVYVVAIEHRGYFDGILVVGTDENKVQKIAAAHKTEHPNDGCCVVGMVVDAEVNDG